jgi:hypothetical protein
MYMGPRLSILNLLHTLAKHIPRKNQIERLCRQCPQLKDIEIREFWEVIQSILRAEITQSV